MKGYRSRADEVRHTAAHPRHRRCSPKRAVPCETWTPPEGGQKNSKFRFRSPFQRTIATCRIENCGSDHASAGEDLGNGLSAIGAIGNRGITGKKSPGHHRSRSARRELRLATSMPSGGEADFAYSKARNGGGVMKDSFRKNPEIQKEFHNRVCNPLLESV